MRKLKVSWSNRLDDLDILLWSKVVKMQNSVWISVFILFCLLFLSFLFFYIFYLFFSFYLKDIATIHTQEVITNLLVVLAMVFTSLLNWLTIIRHENKPSENNKIKTAILEWSCTYIYFLVFYFLFLLIFIQHSSLTYFFCDVYFLSLMHHVYYWLTQFFYQFNQ
jgi:hypothetical protein